MNKYNTILKKVEKPARYTGGELNAVMKNPEKIKVHFAFAFPDLYEIGMSFSGMQIIYNILNQHSDFYCERAFAPAKDMEKLLREKEIPLFSIETNTPLKEFDMIGFTLQYELSYTNILNMIDLAGLPVRTKDRTKEMPVIIAGGPCAFNPEPLAPFIDLFLVGDGEESVVLLCELYMNTESKADFLKKAAELEGVYVPSVYDSEPYQVKKSLIRNLDKQPYPEKPIVPYIESVHDRAVIETFRGCTRGCRFCQAGMIYRPVRERRPQTIKKLAISQLKNTGHEELSLLSLSTSDYSKFEPLVMDLMSICEDEHVSLSLPSLRLDSFSFKVLQEIQKVRKSGLTFAPEAGTQRLRDVVNKSITDEDIYGAVRQAITLGWNQIKLYFMVGLPTETEKDLDGIAEIAKNILAINEEIYGRKNSRFNVTISVSNFVPKPHTPFQWVAQNTAVEFNAKHNYLSNILPKRNVKYQYHDSFESILEGIFARGDRQVADLLETAWRKGCVFDGWSEFLNKSAWRESMEETGINAAEYCHRVRDYEEELPWDKIDSRVSKKFLISESLKALEGQQTADCRRGCTGCGIC
jgi:radical SAM family uncharacterized protein